jgi:hypothetical protein
VIFRGGRGIGGVYKGRYVENKGKVSGGGSEFVGKGRK